MSLVLDDSWLAYPLSCACLDAVCKFAEHLEKVGDGLRKATDCYNSAAASWTNRILPSGRCMNELGVAPSKDKLPDLSPVEVAPRLPAGERIGA